MTQPTFDRVVVAGGSGLVGRALTRALLAAGCSVQILSRHPERASLPPGAQARDWNDLPSTLEGADAIINLAGEGIAEGRWSPSRKAAIRDSRTLATRRIVEAMKACAQPPAALVNASALGFYGSRDEAPVDEEADSGMGFLPEVCRAWEMEAMAAVTLGVRVALIRIGVVLAREGGALPKMALPLRCFMGCKLGSGKQGLSWIHIDDLVAMLMEAARNADWKGPINGTAPGPLSQEAFMRLLARQLHRPLLPLPGAISAAATRMLLGDMAEALLLQGAYVLPVQARALGFQWRFPTAEAAFKDLLP